MKRQRYFINDRTIYTMFLLASSVLVVATGCRQSAVDESPRGVAVADSSPDEQSSKADTADSDTAVGDVDPRRLQVTAARDELFKRLSTRLMAAMGQGGPAAAIPVCRDEAPRIAQQVGQSLGLSIGRTSWKLRNLENAPPAWARDWVEQRVEEPRFQDLPDGRFAALLPIRLKAQCLACHGPAESLHEDVRAALATNYPNDQATGFQDGDLRGWFWVEVPSADN